MSTTVITETAPPPAPESPVRKTTTLTGLQKAAVLMVILGEDTSATVLRELDEDEVQRIGREIASIPVITSEMAEEVLSEFYQMLVAQQYVLKGGMDYARKILVSAFGADHARRLLDQVSKALGHDSASFYALQKADPQQLGEFHSQRASANHCADSFPPGIDAGCQSPFFAARGPARRCCDENGESGPDLTGNHFENRQRDRTEIESAGRDKP